MERDPLASTFKALFPELRQREYPTIGAGTETLGDIKEQLANGACHAILANQITYREFVHSDAWMSCNTRVVEKPVHATAGFALPLENGCVARAFDVVLESLLLSGGTRNIRDEWLQPKECSGSSQALLATPRKSSDNEGHRRRRLASAKAKAGAAAGGQDGNIAVFGKENSAAMTNQMMVLDMLGIFVVWGVASVVSLIAAAIKLMMKRKRKERKSSRQGEQESVQEAKFSAIGSAPEDGGLLAKEVQQIASLVAVVAKGQTTISSKLREREERRRTRVPIDDGISTTNGMSTTSSRRHTSHASERRSQNGHHGHSRRVPVRVSEEGPEGSDGVKASRGVLRTALRIMLLL